jgi:hypothetical protein
MTGSSLVKTKLLAVPPPSVFLETIKDHARSQALLPEPATPPATPSAPPATPATPPAPPATSTTPEP